MRRKIKMAIKIKVNVKFRGIFSKKRNKNYNKRRTYK
jgi:hypothetical protein